MDENEAPVSLSPYPRNKENQHMCRPTKCKKCSNTTWAGCGQHVAQVKAMVPSNQWCRGHANEPAAPGDGGFFGKLFGR